ncbi:MAG: STAS domain-containing protein [Clostridia bacterium]|nr:STAS domain-containing protein [Clostridia bacterium]
MTINKTLNGTELIVAIVGRLDTTTAPQLDEEINQSIMGVEKLVIDVAEMEYISSAGLRVLLSAHKKMTKQGSMVIRNVSEIVMDIFDVTGFSDILTIEA